MEPTTDKIEGAKNAFNNIKISKGQFMTIATCDSEGNPNVAPIGSMRVVNDKTVHVLQGFLPRTLKNLRTNPKASFSVVLGQSLLQSLLFFLSPKNKSLGYQVYCEFKGTDDKKETVERETNQLVNRVPFLFRGVFRKFCKKNLKQLLIFQITDIREIASPS